MAYRLYARSACDTKSAAAAAVCGLYMLYAMTPNAADSETISRPKMTENENAGTDSRCPISSALPRYRL